MEACYEFVDLQEDASLYNYMVNLAQAQELVLHTTPKDKKIAAKGCV